MPRTFLGVGTAALLLISLAPSSSSTPVDPIVACLLAGGDAQSCTQVTTEHCGTYSVVWQVCVTVNVWNEYWAPSYCSGTRPSGTVCNRFHGSDWGTMYPTTPVALEHATIGFKDHDGLNHSCDTDLSGYCENPDSWAENHWCTPGGSGSNGAGMATVNGNIVVSQYFVYSSCY